MLSVAQLQSICQAAFPIKWHPQMLQSTEMISALQWCVHVDCLIRCMLVMGSGLPRGVNHSTYVRGWESCPKCVGRLKSTQICATWSPVETGTSWELTKSRGVDWKDCRAEHALKWCRRPVSCGIVNDESSVKVHRNSWVASMAISSWSGADSILQGLVETEVAVEG